MNSQERIARLCKEVDCFWNSEAKVKSWEVQKKDVKQIQKRLEDKYGDAFDFHYDDAQSKLTLQRKVLHVWIEYSNGQFEMIPQFETKLEPCVCSVEFFDKAEFFDDMNVLQELRRRANEHFSSEANGRKILTFWSNREPALKICEIVERNKIKYW